MSIRQRIISAFIILQTITIIQPTKTFENQSAAQKPFYIFGLWTRTLQTWNLFAPEPRRYASYYQVEVMYNDFTKYMWRRPYPTNWGFFYRHLCYNWQKYDLAATHMEMPIVWDDIVNFIVRQDFVTKSIKRVRLSKMVAPWPPPKSSGYVFTEVEDLHWTDSTIFVYDLEQKKYL